MTKYHLWLYLSDIGVKNIIQSTQVSRWALTKRLIVKGDQLAASVPEDVRHEVRRVDASAFWKYPTELSPIVFDKFDRVLFQHGDRIGFVE